MRRIALAGVALALSLTAACGSDSDSSSPTTTAPAVSLTSAAPYEGPRDAAAYTAALARGMTNEDQVNLGELTDEQATCISGIWVDALGVEAFTSQGIDPPVAEEPSFDIRSLAPDIDQATKMIDAYAACEVDLEAVYLDVLTTGLPADAATCVREAVAEEIDVRAMMISTMASSDGLDPKFAEPLGALQERCVPAG